MPLETKHFPLNFYIIKNNSLNAFAAPGGHIFVYSGLVEVVDSAHELAAVICHEIGHVSARHLAQRLEQNKKIGLATMAGILAGVLIGGPVAEALVTGSVAAGIQTQLQYSRKDEQQADQLGFKYMNSATFDPKGMLTTLKKIARESWLGSDKSLPYLMTHPTGPERMSNLDTMLSQYMPQGPAQKTTRFTELFPFFKTIVRAKCLDSHEAERLFKLDLKKGPASPFPHLGLGLIYKERSRYPEAINHLRTALERAPHFIPILTNIGEAYQMNGQNEEAITVLERALEKGEGNSSTMFLLGLSYENLEQYEKAIQLLEKLASFKPVKNEVYYHLGISYGRQERLGLAHYNFGLYFKRLGQIQKAQFHFKKAGDFSGNNPTLKRKIHEATKRFR
jgi:predicted Zn-dependent protease